MNKTIVLIVLFLLCHTSMYSQNVIRGIIIDNNSEKPLSEVLISIKNTIFTTKTDLNGAFHIKALFERKLYFRN